MELAVVFPLSMHVLLQNDASFIPKEAVGVAFPTDGCARDAFGVREEVWHPTLLVLLVSGCWL